MKQPLLDRLQFASYALALILVFSLLGYLGSYPNTAVWRVVDAPGVTEIEDVSAVTVPQPEAPVGREYQYRFTLPEKLSEDLSLVFCSYHSRVSVYLEGGLVYQMAAAENIPGIKTDGGVWNVISLGAVDAGKTVLVVMQPVYEDYTSKAVFLLGDPARIYRAELSASLPEIVLSLLNLLVGLALVLYGIYSFFCSKGHQRNTFALGALAICTGLWRLTYAKFAAFLLESGSQLIFYVSLTSLGMVGVTLLIASRSPIENRWQRFRTLICTLMSLVISGQLILQWLGVMDLRESLTLVHGMILLSSVIILAERIILAIYYRKTGLAHVEFDHAWMLALGSVVDLGIFLLRRGSNGLLFTLFAMLVYVSYEGVRVLRQNYREKQYLAATRELLNTHDALTGLRNRDCYMQQVRELEDHPPASLGVLILEIHGLGRINQSSGLEYGDNVLRRFAAILRDRFPECAYRTSGDEFAVLRPDLSEEEFNCETTELQAFLDQQKICEISMGVAWSGEEEQVDMQELQIRAREICNVVKQSYYYRTLDAGTSVAVSGYGEEVVRQIADGAFTVYYQPQIDLKTGKLVGAEALVRKIAEDGSLISPAKFIPFYEVSGVIHHVDLFVLQSVCTALRRWKEQGYDLRVSVNFSRTTLLEPRIVKVIDTICEEAGISPADITIEVTESISKMHHDQLQLLIRSLKERGFGISLDDFGSQYSNLAILADMDFDEIKLDRSLVSTLEESEKSRKIMEAMLQLCHTMGDAATLAEGIETKEQLELLQSYQCKLGQGYHFSRPLPEQQFERFVKERA